MHLDDVALLHLSLLIYRKSSQRVHIFRPADDSMCPANSWPTSCPLALDNCTRRTSFTPRVRHAFAGCGGTLLVGADVKKIK